MTEVKVESVAELDLGTRHGFAHQGVFWRNLASLRAATIHVVDADVTDFDGPGVEISFDVDCGSLVDCASVVVPFAAVAELVDAERARTAA